MPFIDTDSSNDPFVNVSHRVGETGDWDDLLAVQLMLEFVYSTSSLLKKTKPIRGPITVNGKPAPDTPILIAHFQKTILKRANPKTFMDKAVGKAKDKENYAICRLSQYVDWMLASIGSSENVVSFLRRKVPLLASSLKTGVEALQEDFQLSPITP